MRAILLKTYYWDCADPPVTIEGGTIVDIKSVGKDEDDWLMAKFPNPCNPEQLLQVTFLSRDGSYSEAKIISPLEELALVTEDSAI